MPNFQCLDEELTYFTLQNVPCTQSTGDYDFFCGVNDLMSDDMSGIKNMEGSGLYLKIIEQPATTFRYRYKSEKGSHGGIKGENTALSKKSFPTVKVENCPPTLKKKVFIKVSLYTNEPKPNDHKPHVYELIGKHSGGSTLNENSMAVFQSLAICTRKKEEVLKLLKERIKANYDSKGISYNKASVEAEAQEEMKNINLDSARLCFEAFSTDDLSTPLCAKVYSNPINNQKSAARGDLKISHLSHYTGNCSGGEKVILLCEKVKKEDIKVRFFDENGWEKYAEFNPADIHHQVAIIFKTPAYCEANVHKLVFIQLVRPSDNTCSDTRDFRYKPDDGIHTSNGVSLSNFDASLNGNGPSEISRKRKRMENESSEANDSMDSPDSNLSSEESNLLFDPKGTHLDILGDWILSFDSELQSPDSCEFQELISSQEQKTCFSGFAFTDGINEISDSINSMSLADTCSNDVKDSEIWKASNDFMMGMKKILANRDLKTYLHFATHLIPLQDEDGNNMLHLGIMEQNKNLNCILKMVKLASEDMLNHQNKFKETPLHLAVKGNHVSILRFLLARGCNPNLSDGNGNNCLHLAAKYGHINCLKVLMTSSETERTRKHPIDDIDMLNYDGMSALHIAITGKFEDCVDFLLNLKANVNLPEKKGGRTSLHLAVEHPFLLQAILKQPNVNINAEDFRGYTAVQLACLKTGKSFEVVSAQLKDDKDEIVKFLENFSENERGCDSTSSEVESDGESTDLSEFEDAVEDFCSVSPDGAVLQDASTSKCNTTEKKSSLMKIEEELHRYLDKDDKWKLLADLIGLDTNHIALLDKGLSPGQTVLRKIKDLYHPCQSHTIIEMLKIAGLQEGIQILQKNSLQC